MTIYKRGFASLDGPPSVQIGDAYGGIIRLKKLDDSFEHQTNYMVAVERAKRCYGGDFLSLERPLLRQLESDAAALSTTPEQLQFVNKEFYFGGLDLLPNSPAPKPRVSIGTSPMAPQRSAASH